MDPRQTDVSDEMRRATQALVKARRPVLRMQPPDTPPGLGAAVLAFVVLAAVLFALVVRVSVSDRQTAPAIASDTSSMVRVDGSSPARGRFMLTAVRKRSDTGTRVATSKVAMAMSQRNALRAALDCVAARGGRSVSVDAGRVVGGSAGLMFALTIVDALEPFDTDARIAGTGTISPTGVIGPIIDIELKARAAHDAGADQFFAPKAQAAAAERAAPRLRVVGVDTLDEAVRKLGRAAGCDPTRGEDR